MNLKRMAVAAMIAVLIAGFAAPGMAMDRFDRIWLRDTLIGGAIGLGLGVVGRCGGCLLVGLIAGGVFGYLDAEKKLVVQDDPAAPWNAGSLAPPISVEARSIAGREEPEYIVKAAVYQARW